MDSTPAYIKKDNKIRQRERRKRQKAKKKDKHKYKLLKPLKSPDCSISPLRL